MVTAWRTRGLLSNAVPPARTHGFLGDAVLAARDLELEAETVDRDAVFARVVLRDAGQEGLREVEARDPEDGGRAGGDPLLRDTRWRR